MTGDGDKGIATTDGACLTAENFQMGSIQST